MNGIIIVNKPQGWTSFDVVAKIRSLTGVKKVGHSGTLDPMATGVLPVFLGKATKFIQYFLNGDKGYEGEMILGIRTDTGDADGEILTPIPSPSKMERGEELNVSRVRMVFEKYIGEIEQIPPMYSAVKVKGKRLYELARKGIEIKRQPRKVTIYDLRFTSDDIDIANDKRIAFRVFCSKGTYIRQLVMDIGDELGCGACLSKLVRIYSHPFHISQAIDMEVIITMAQAGILSSIILNPEEILEEMKKVPS